MKSVLKPLLIVALAATATVVLISLPSAATANTIVFSDNFDSEVGSGDGPSGQSGLNYASFANWTVSDGFVDLIADGDFGIQCVNSSGKCVDLAGSSNPPDPGALTSATIDLAPGIYDLSFELAGVDSSFVGGGAELPNVVDVTIGSLFVDQITRNQGDPFEVFGGQFSVTETTTVQIAFANQGDDNFGAMLDNVLLVPEPGTFALLATALIGLGWAHNQRRSTRRRVKNL